MSFMLTRWPLAGHALFGALVVIILSDRERQFIFLVRIFFVKNYYR